MRLPAFDLRALAVFRMALCLLLLLDLGRWVTDFAFFFTSRGPLPLAAVAVDVSVGEVGWSLYNATSYSLAPYLLFATTVATTVALGLGWRSRIASPLLFVLMLSLQNRAPVALDEADGWLLMLLAFGAFAPWDRALTVSPPPPAASSPRFTSHPSALGLGIVALAICLCQAAHDYQQNGVTLWSALWLLTPTLFLGTPGAVRNGMAVLLSLFFLLFVPGPSLMPWLAAATLTIWLSFDRKARLSMNPGIAVLLNVAGAGLVWASTSLPPAPPRQAQAFVALGPRAVEISSDVWFAPVAIGVDGKQWDLLHPDREPSLQKPATPYLSDSYRKRLYLGSLPQQRNWGLRYWLAYDAFIREQIRLGTRRLQRVEIYRCQNPGDEASRTLFARWPMAN